MRSRIFCKKFKSLVLVALAAFLILPSFLTIFKFTTSASAASCTDTSKAYCYVIKIYANEYASNVGHTATEVEYRTLTLSTDSNTFTYKNDVSQSVSGRTVNVSVNFQLDNGGNVVDSYSQSSGMFNLGPTRIEFYASDGTTLLQNETFQTTSGSTRSITVQGSTTGGGTQPTGQPTEGSTGENVTCMSSGSAGSLGWIICSVLDVTQKAVDGLYDSFVEPNLKIEPTLFNPQQSDTGKNTQEAWSTFRDFANVAFVIFLLFVIFSQVTGIGIDNYGIKKTLPKLIVAAILVNVSYYICMGVIDITNILGNSIQGIFDGISTGSMSIDGQSVNIAADGIVSVAILATLVGGGFAVFANPALLLTLLVSVLGLLVSLFFLFVLLAAREAVLVISVVISPLAFVCYMLPNTKNLFDKWMKLVRSLLMVYPIAALLVSGGSFVSRLLLSAGFASGGFAKAFAAIIVGIIPIFFIPSVLRSSLAVAGNLGAKISSFGRTARTGATRGIQNSGVYKGIQQRGFERSTRIRAGIDRNGNARDLNRFQRMIRGGGRNVARSRVAYSKQQDASAAFEAALDPNFIQNQNEFREDKNRKMREDAIIAQITRNGEYGGQSYGAGGKDLNALYARFVTLSNQGDNVSSAERDERGAIYRKLASEKQGINLLNDSIYRVGQQGQLSVEGLRTMNAHRMQNADVAAALARKDTTGNMYLDDFAAGATVDNTHANGVLSSNEISARYAARALSDNQRIADQSGAALARHIQSVAPNQIANLINDSNFRGIVTDAGNQQIVEDVHHVNTQGAAGPTQTVNGFSGNFYAAPNGWRLLRRTSQQAGHPIYADPNDPTGRRRYDASTNRFSQ